LCVLSATLAAAPQAPGPPPGRPPIPAPPSGAPAGQTQAPPRPPGGPPFRAATGTSRIRGRVVSDNGLPVRGAEVSLSGNAVAALKSDDNGRFEFVDLPPGNFTLDASKAGFAGPIVINGGMPSDISLVRTFAVADGQTVERTITLTRGAVIRGRVVDAFGDPITEAEIRVERFVYGPGSSRQLVQHSSGVVAWLTDDRGEYRVFGVPPGEVLVSSTVRDLIVGSGQTLTDRGEHDLKGVPGPWRIFAVET
jgi:hypothetical protein